MDEVVRSAVAPFAARLSRRIAQLVAKLTAERIQAELARVPRARRGAGRSSARPRKLELTRWVADNRARRVPNFVIDLTGLKTKKQIVARYGENATFEKARPLPPEAKSEPRTEPKAKGPTVRRKAKAA